MARNIIFESLTTEITKLDNSFQGYLSINDNKNINNDLVNIVNDANIYVICDDNSEIELSITKKEVDTESALKSFNCEFDNGFIKTDNITNVMFSISLEKTPIKFVFYTVEQDEPVMLKSGGLRNSSDISKIKVNSAIYNIKDSSARASLELKQDTLVSGTNIKTIDGTSLLGSGNITTNNVFVAIKNVTTYADLEQAINDNKIIVVGSDIPGRAQEYVVVDAHRGFDERNYIQLVVYDGTSVNRRFEVYEGLQTWGVFSTNLQQELISGTNIKTINNTSLLGSGNINIQGGGNYTTIQLGTTWTGTAPNLQQVASVTSVTSSDKPDLSVIATSATTFDDEYLAWSKVWKAESGAGQITFYAYEETETAITVAVRW